MNSVDNIIKAINLLSYEPVNEVVVTAKDLRTLVTEIKNQRILVVNGLKEVVKYRREMNHALAKQLEMLENDIPRLDVRI